MEYPLAKFNNPSEYIIKLTKWETNFPNIYQRSFLSSIIFYQHVFYHRPKSVDTFFTIGKSVGNAVGFPCVSCSAYPSMCTKQTLKEE